MEYSRGFRDCDTKLRTLSYDWTLKNGELTRTFIFSCKETSENFVSAAVITTSEKLEVKPKPPVCRESTYTEYGGMSIGGKDDGSSVIISLLEGSVITPRDVMAGRKIDACYEKCYYTP